MPGRKIAELNKARIIGTFGVLILAKKQGLITEIRPSVEILWQSSMWVKESIVDKALKEAGE